MKRLCIFAILMVCCACMPQQNYVGFDEETVCHVDSIIRSNRSVDSLNVILERFERQGNCYGMIASCRELGRSYRNASMFSEAVDVHKKGLNYAIEAKDTIEIIWALNNIGTDFRRMSILDEASEYHYQALAYTHAYSDTTSVTAIKNRVVSLNGIGNVHLTLGNQEEAESVFRQALAGETLLGSYVGQAINYANIGAILEAKGQIDSARCYYSESLRCNTEAESALGVSLCHTYFGRLYENEGRLDKAIAEYTIAYDIMTGNKDKWHWLESILSLSRAYAANSDIYQAKKYLSEAKTVAEGINSTEHLVEVFRQEYELELGLGNYRRALDAYIKSSEYAKQVTNEKNLTHIQNVRVRYEREKKATEISLLRSTYLTEKRSKNIILITFFVSLLFAILTIIFLLYIIYLRKKNLKMMKEVERTRTNFFTNITHEFRTPLSIIISAAQDIQARNKSDKTLQRDSADIIRHGKGLLDLVNQILDIAKISSGLGVSPKWKRADVIGFITMICEGHLKYAERKDLRIAYGFEVERLEMDFIPSYMIRIVQNLLSNAIKFSYPGSDILVSVKVIPTERCKMMQLYVCDTGVGMTQEQKEVIFKPFYQAHDDTHNIGSGVGLSLVKLTAEAMGGKVEVHSYPSKGSVFIVTIPISESVSDTDLAEVENYTVDFGYSESVTPEDDDTSYADAPRILIVEDTPDVARWQMRQLNPEYNFYFASNGEEGYQKALDIVPDLVITDVMMPLMDGYELCEKIRGSELLCHIPVIMVTAKSLHDDKIRGLDAGADAYIEKPFHPDELAVRVVKLLEQRAMLRKKFVSLSDDSANDFHEEMSVSDRNFIEELSSVIHAHISSGKINYDAIASEFCVGKTQLNRKIKAVTGYTTTEYVLQIRISMAKQLLMKTDYPIGDIATRVGIEDVAYFSSLFRKSTGMTPTAFRCR